MTCKFLVRLRSGRLELNFDQIIYSLLCAWFIFIYTALHMI